MSPSNTSAIRLLLVDDHALFLEGIERLLEGRQDFTVVGATQDFTFARKILSTTPIDVLVLDFDLGRERATPIVRTLNEEGFSGKILVVTAGVSETEAIQLIRAGVAGIFHKHHGSEALCEAIRLVAAGEPYLESAYVGTVFRTLGPEPESAPPRLSEREVRILRLIFQGLANKEIATKLGMTESGVKSALRTLFEKIGAKTRSQAVRIALENYRAQL
jgi:two-component system nitrate/nitrite response regulator NarL